MELYIESEQLTKRIKKVAESADTMSDHVLVYEEMVAIPCFGQIILRFDLNIETCTPDDLDRYESLLYGIAGDEFTWESSRICFMALLTDFLFFMTGLSSH